MTYCSDFRWETYLDNGFPEILRGSYTKPEFHVLCEIPSTSFKGEKQVIEVRVWFDEYPSTEEFKDTISEVVPYERILETKCIHYGHVSENIWGSLEDVDESRRLLEEEEN